MTRCLKITCQYQCANVKPVRHRMSSECYCFLQQLNYQYLLWSINTHWFLAHLRHRHTFLPVPRAYSAICIWKYREKPKFHCPETAALNVTTTQFRPNLQRLITLANEAELCHFLLAPRRFHSISDLRIVFSPSIWSAFPPASKRISNSPPMCFNPCPTERVK